MKVKHILIIAFIGFVWIQFGGVLTNYLYPGYGCTTLNNNHILFFIAWILAYPPIVGIFYIRLLTKEKDVDA